MLQPDAIAPTLAPNILTPDSPAALAAILAECNAARRAVIPYGGGTLQHLGNAPARRDTQLMLTQLNRVVEYAFDDLTITVEAGMTVAELSAVLGEHKQFLPIDVPHPERATIGGVLAAGANGPLRLKYGPARDYMIGNRFATADGQVIKAGSKVVKNVAGYELHKVMVGSLGTLGVITEATFKIFPKPPAETTLWATFAELGDACLAVTKLWNLPTPPYAIELLDARAAKWIGRGSAGHSYLAVRFGGSKPDMAAAQVSSTAVAREQNATSTEIIEDAAAFWQGINDLPAAFRSELPNATLLRISLPPQNLQLGLKRLFDLIHIQHLAIPPLLAHAAVAALYAALEGDEPAVIAILQALRPQMHALQGHVIVESAPAPLRAKLDAWDEPGASFRLMRALKQKFDPNGILNPGRFVGGL